MSPLAVIFVPGFWEGASVSSPVSELLRASGHYSVSVATLRSTGNPSPGNPTLEDDTGAIRNHIEHLVNGDNEVVLVLHSAGGFLGCNAIKGLTAKERTPLGLKGGVKKIIFVCAGVFEKGTMTGALPFFDIKGDELHCKDPRKTLFNDVPDEVAEVWLAQLRCQPARGWDAEIAHNGARDVPSTYLLCEDDAAVPPSVQRQFAALAGSEIKQCKAGHMVMVSKPEVVVETIEEAIRSMREEH